MRVLHVLDSFESGGAQRVVLQMSLWMSSRGVRSAVFGQPGALQLDIPPSVPVFLSRGGFLAQTVGLYKACRTLRPHILHAHQRREALASVIVGGALGIPVVEHAHTFLPGRQLAALSFRSRWIFAVSAQVGHMVTSTYRRHPHRVTVVGNTAASTSAVPPTTRPPAIAPGGGRARVIGIGRLVEQKDPERFVRIIARAGAQIPLEAVWFGEGPMRAAAEALAARLGAPVRFAGQSADITREIDDSDVLLMTSRWEGTPLVALEAFTRRRQVVATAAVGSAGLLAEGRALSVSDTSTDEEFAAALVGALTDADAAAGRVELAYRFAVREASPDRVFGPVLEAYRLVFAERRRTRRPFAAEPRSTARRTAALSASQKEQ